MKVVAFRAGVLLFLLALAVRIALIFALGSYRNIERTEVDNVAIALAQKGQFADAYGPGSGPTAHVAPIYPLLLSCIFRIFGIGTMGEIAQEIFSSTLASITCVLLPSVAVAFGISRSIGLWAGLWMALLPVNYWSETKGSFEGALSALALVITCRFLAVVWTRRQFSPLEACEGGALVGIVLLISPSILPVITLLFASGLWLFREKLIAYVRYICLFAAVAFAILIPWAVRNEYALGSPIFTRSNFGLELAVSNNDFSHVEHDDNFLDPRVHRFHPFVNADARAEMMRMGEVAFERDRKNQAISWIASHPGRFLELTAGRFALFWFPQMVRLPQTILIRLESLAGIIGFILLWRTNNPAKWIFGALWAGYPVVYYLLHAFARYRYPIDWSFVLLGSFAVFLSVAPKQASSIKES